MLQEPTRLGVLGWPVAHSRSPAMQNAALAAVGLDAWRYQLLPVPPALFMETVSALPGAGFRGANVTIPHKHAALAVATAPTERARAIGAANTLLFEPDGAIRADNTDAPGDDRLAAVPGRRSPSARPRGGGECTGRRMGAHRRGRGHRLCVEPHRRPGRALVQRAGRDSRARRPARGCPHPLYVQWAGRSGTRRFKHVPVTADDLDRYECVVDFVYTKPAHAGTALVEAARARSIPVVDGFDLLVAQGALAFEQFTSRPAPTELMRAAARGH